MSSYTDIFGGATVSPSYLNYAEFALTALNSPLTLVWPLQFENSVSVIAQIVDLTSDAGGRTIVMPDATLVSVGQSVLFTNRGGYAITINASDNATLIETLASGEATYIYLTDNTSTNGTWHSIPWGSGVVGVISVAAVSTSSNLTISGSPITGSGTFTFSLAGNLDPIANLTGTGYLARTGTNTWALRTYNGTVNQITISNAGGVAATSTFALATNVSGINSITAGNIQVGVNGTNTITTVGNDALIIDEDLSLDNQHSLTFFDSTGVGYVAFQAPTTTTTNVIYTLPDAPPASNGLALISSTAGVLSWGASSGGSVTSILAGTGLTATPNPIVAAGTIGISNTGVFAGFYTNANITVNAQGQITSAANGAGGGTITNIATTGGILGGTITTTGTLSLTSSIGGKNLLYNGDFQLWQRGTTFSASTAPTGMYTADRWQFGLNSNSYAATFSQVAGAVPGTYAMRVNRTSGGAVAAGSIELLQSLPISSCVGLAGQYLTITFTIRAGTDFNGGNLTTGLGVAVTTGTDATNISDLYGYYTGRKLVIQPPALALSTSWQTFTFTSPAPIDTDVTQVSTVFVYIPQGGAGSVNDYYEIENIKLEAGTASTNYVHNDLQTNLTLCEAFYCKSFDLTTTPAQNIGTNTGELFFPSTVVGAASIISQSVYFPQTMLAMPLMTLYNPSAANAQIRNESRSQDLSGSTIGDHNQKGFVLLGTGSAGTIVSDALSVHWTAQAELFNAGFPS